MFPRLKSALVRSYAGAIALGWIFGEAVEKLVTFGLSPFDIWLAGQITPGFHFSVAAEARYAIPSLTTSLLLFLVGYVLLRWLYYSPPAN